MNLKFKKVTSKSKNDIEILVEFMKKNYDSNFLDIFSARNIEILKSFLKIDTVKNEISYGEKEYYLISCDDENIGFFEFSVSDVDLRIDNIYLDNHFIFKESVKFIQQYANEHNINTILSYIPVQFVNQLSLYREIGFVVIKQVARYCGSGIYYYCYMLEKS